MISNRTVLSSRLDAIMALFRYKMSNFIIVSQRNYRFYLINSKGQMINLDKLPTKSALMVDMKVF